MARDPYHDLIKIKNAPANFTDRDCLYFERIIDECLREHEPDHAVRCYKEYDSHFLIVYLGSSKRRGEVIDFLLKNKL